MIKTNTDFLCIKDSKNTIDKFFREIKFKLDRLSVIYRDYIKKSNLSEEYLISLDTLNFQEILIKTDVANYKNLYDTFLNQCYCQYFKLYQKIVIFLTKKYRFEKDITLDILTTKTFTIYKDLQEHHYEFTETEEIYQTICDIILYIKNYVNKQTFHLKDDEIKIQNGIYIQNLLYEKKHDIDMLDDKIDLYNKILENYIIFQDNFLKRMLLKMKVLYSQINADISLETIDCDKVSITTKINQYFKSHRICKDFEQLIEREFNNGVDKPTDGWNMVHVSHAFKKWKKFMLDNHTKKYHRNMCILSNSFDKWKDLIKKPKKNSVKKIGGIFIIFLILFLNFYFAKLNQTFNYISQRGI
jgi:hypothetical protein